MRYTMDTQHLGVTYDRTKAMDIPEEQFKLCKEANGQFCPLTTPLQPLTNPPSCVAALYTKNSRKINRLCELTTKTQPELYLPIPLASNVWAIISSPFKQQLPVTVICPTRPATSIHISPPIHVLRLEPACSATSQHFHLPPKYKDTHIMMNLSIYNANLDIINISSALFRITQHIPSVQQQETLERLAALPPVPIKRITMELMGEVLQETLSNDKPFWLHPSFLMGCIGFVVSIMSTVACIAKKKVAAWKPCALTGFLSLCRKDKNNTKMDDKDMDAPIYQPSGIIQTVIRPQESHGCVLFPNQHERKIAVSEAISLMESLTLPWDQNSTQKPVLETQKRQTTYRKIQEMVPLQDRSKEDKRIRIKDFNKDNVEHQSMSIRNQS